VLPLYVARLPAQVRQLRALHAAGDRDALRALAHQLKGSGTTYGFPAISDLARSLEQALMTRHPEPGPLVESLAQYLEHVEGYVVE
jgi:HPt (histidine-containing phosphotransfer) domain-containing protein